MPDPLGCFSACKTIDELMENARHPIDQYVGIMIEDGVAIPAGRPLAVHQADLDYAGWVWAIVDVPVEKYRPGGENQYHRAPVDPGTLYQYAKSRGMSRRGFLVEAARSAMHA